MEKKSVVPMIKGLKICLMMIGLMYISACEPRTTTTTTFADGTEVTEIVSGDKRTVTVKSSGPTDPAAALAEHKAQLLLHEEQMQLHDQQMKLHDEQMEAMDRQLEAIDRQIDAAGQ